MERGLLLIHHIADLRLRCLHVPIEIDDPRCTGKNILNGLSQRDPLPLVRSVDFGDQGLEDWRTGRNFGHGHRGAKSSGYRGDQRSRPLGDGVALVRALALSHEVDLNVSNVRASAHIIVPYEAIKIEGGRSAGVNLDVTNRRVRPDGHDHFSRDPGGLLKRGALRRFEHDLKLRFVVEWQHLDCHRAG